MISSNAVFGFAILVEHLLIVKYYILNLMKKMFSSVNII
jgi:hypothetical protein